MINTATAAAAAAAVATVAAAATIAVATVAGLRGASIGKQQRTILGGMQGTSGNTVDDHIKNSQSQHSSITSSEVIPSGNSSIDSPVVGTDANHGAALH